MGGGQSKRNEGDGANVSKYENKDKPAKQHNIKGHEEDDDCQCNNPLEILLKLTGREKRSPFDHIGTPMPDPPTHFYQRRAARQQAEADGDYYQETENYKKVGFGGGAYGGLETEAEVDDFDAAANLPPSFSRGILETEEDGHYQGGFYEQPREIEILEGLEGERALHQTYEIFEILGVGSTSTVHRCRDRRTGVEYACKIIDILHVEQQYQGMIQQFRTEIHALRSLHHPHIIKLYNVYIADNKIYIIMELMEGGEVFDYVVERGAISEEDASDIVRKVTSALAYIHTKNIIHRDLKPENLLLKHKPRAPGDLDVKIIDFGLSKRMDEPVARSFLGTRGYLAPEMLQRKEYSNSVDAWSLGVVVFVLLCGCLPFDDIDPATRNNIDDDIPSDAVIKSKFTLRFPRWASNISAPARDLLSHLLDVDPNTRYTAEQALNHPWVTGKAASKNYVLRSPTIGGDSQRFDSQRNRSDDNNNYGLEVEDDDDSECGFGNGYDYGDSLRGSDHWNEHGNNSSAQMVINKARANSRDLRMTPHRHLVKKKSI